MTEGEEQEDSEDVHDDEDELVEDKFGMISDVISSGNRLSSSMMITGELVGSVTNAGTRSVLGFFEGGVDGIGEMILTGLVNNEVSMISCSISWSSYPSVMLTGETSDERVEQGLNWFAGR